MADEQSEAEALTRAGQKRRKAMIEAAYELFMEKGYAAVSLDEIISVSKGSKSSLYKYFGNKEGILKAVIEALAEQMVQEFDVTPPANAAPFEALRRLGMVLAEMALSENAINQHRHAVAHARAFPDIAKLWFASGPQQSLRGLARYLEQESAAGRLEIDDPERAAWLFAGMILFRDNMRLLVGLQRPRRSALEPIVAEAVRVFLAAYQPRARKPR